MKFVKYALQILIALIVLTTSFGVYWFILPAAISGNDVQIVAGITVTVIWSLILFVILGITGTRFFKKLNPPQ